MSTTIDSLDIQIKTSAGSASANIDELASALGRLKENGKISATVNNLTKLKGALDGLKSVSGLENIARIGDALKGLQSIGKLSGLSSAVNSLKKIPDITKGLDMSTLDAFAQKMKQLSTALAPLATQINAVSQGFSKLPVKIKQLVTGTEKLTSATKSAASAQATHRVALDKTNINIAAAIANIRAYIGAIQQIIQTVASFMAQAIEWDGIQARFGRAFGDNAQETLNWVDKLTEGLMINKQEFMQYSSLFAEMLTGFGVNQADAGKMAIGYTELAYDIWAAYNDVYKNLGGEEGAIAAVRSAIAGEVEPIRRAGFTIVDSQLAITAANFGVEYSTQNATEAQKSYLRYLTMVQQAADRNIIGVYASEMTTAEGAVRTLSQQLKSLSQALGSLFLPILTTVVPYLTAFVQLLYDAAAAIANFFNIPFFEIDWSRGSSLGGLAEDANDAADELKGAGAAAKKLKSYTMGFDELNVINPNSGGGGGGGSSKETGWEGLDVDSIWDDAIFNNVAKKVDEIKEKLKPLLVAVGLVGAAFLAWKIAPALITGLNTLRAVIGGLAGNKAALSALTYLEKPKLATAVAKISGAFSAIGKFIAGISAGAWAGIAAGILAVASVVVFLKENWEAVTEAVKGFFENSIVPRLEKIRDALEEVIPPEVMKVFKDIGEWIGNIAKKIGEWFASVDWLEAIGTAFETIGGVIFGVVSGVISGAITSFLSMIEGAIKVVGGVVDIVKGVVDAIVSLCKGDLNGAYEAVEDIVVGIATVFEGLYDMTIGAVVEFVKGVIEWFTELWDELVGHSIVPDMIDAIVDWFLSLPSKIFGGIDAFVTGIITKFKNMWTSIKSWWNTEVAPKFTLAYWQNKFNVIKEAIGTKLNEVRQTMQNKWVDIKNWYKDNVAPKFTKEFWIEKFKGIKEGFTHSIKAMVNVGIGYMNRFIGWLNSKMHFSWESFEIAGQEIVPGGSIQLFTIPDIPYLANGGFVDAGQMFIAREAGPELVGSINGRTAVANNDQIVSAVSQGVYSAVLAAMGQSNGSNGQNVNVYLDGKQIYASVKKTESERGMALVGNQLGYAY